MLGCDLKPGDLIEPGETYSGDISMYFVIAVDKINNTFTAINVKGSILSYRINGYGTIRKWWNHL